MEKQLLQPSSAEFNAVNASRLFIQPKLTINQPNDVYEQEADAMADKVMRMEQPGVQLKPLPITSVQRKCDHCEEEEKMQRKEMNGEEAAADYSLENYVGGLTSGGQPLPNKARNFYEPRFGYDFSNVKIHTDTVAAKSAQSINALAYTSGNNIVFNSNQYSPNTESGKRLLGHELTHVVQQGGDSLHLQRQLNPSMCSSDCNKPDNRNGAKGKYQLTVYADKEGPFLLIPLTHNVGHSWLKLVNKAGDVWTYGFWPQEGFDANNLKADVEGCVHHPDKAHTPSAAQTFELTEIEFNDAKAKAILLCNSKPKYNLFNLQCTSFVHQIMTAANKAPASGFGLIWDSPNAFNSWLKSNALLLGFKTTATMPADGSDSTVSLGVGATYTHQFYSLLGNKLRLQWMSTGELGTKIKSLSTGISAEVNPQNIYIPSIYVFGGATVGNLGGTNEGVGAGLKSGLGLNYNIDEIGFIKVEYNLTKNLVNEDPLLHQLSASVGFKF